MDSWHRKGKEMVGGCCVCLDETGWPDNQLVYCDGTGCTVAVHQACYGIINVPDGSWFCKRCESQERQVRLKCELCPSKDGALKRTDNNGWAHIVCALYIPEVSFGNNTTMEPIKISDVPYERFQKSCYICEDKGDSMSAKGKGACISCHYPSCRRSFHVTCAQGSRLLCEEETGSERLDYFGYCEHHISQQHTRTFTQSPAEVNDQSSSNSTVSANSDSRLSEGRAESVKLKKDKLRDHTKGRARSVAHRNRGRHHRSKSMSKGLYHDSASENVQGANDAGPQKKRMTMSAIIAGEESLPLNDANKNNKNKNSIKKRQFPHKYSTSKKVGKFASEHLTDENDCSPRSPSSPHSYNTDDHNIIYKSPTTSMSPQNFEFENKKVADDSDDSDFKTQNNANESMKSLLNQQWKSDTNTLVGYVSSYGDIASLLSLVYMIKSDNEIMKVRIEDLSRKRDYLKVVNEGLKDALSSKDKNEIQSSDKFKIPPQPDVPTEPLQLKLTPENVSKIESVVNKIIMSSEQS